VFGQLYKVNILIQTKAEVTDDTSNVCTALRKPAGLLVKGRLADHRDDQEHC